MDLNATVWAMAGKFHLRQVLWGHLMLISIEATDFVEHLIRPYTVEQIFHKTAVLRAL